MSFFQKIFHRRPTKAQQLVDLWREDRKAAVAQWEKACRGNFYIDGDFLPMLKLECHQAELELKHEQWVRANLRSGLIKSSRLIRLRQRRGLPFKSRRQP